MEGLIFVLLIVVILVVLQVRKRKKQRAQKDQLLLPGRTPETAELIHHPKAIKTFVRRQRCHCGGKIYICAESNVENHGAGQIGYHKDMRVAVCECMRCEDVHRLYFEVEYLN